MQKKLTDIVTVVTVGNYTVSLKENARISRGFIP